MPRILLTIEEIRILRHIQVCLSEQETWEPDAPRDAWQPQDEEDALNASPDQVGHLLQSGEGCLV